MNPRLSPTIANAGFVADASVGVAWVVPSQSGPEADSLLDEVAAGTPFIVPGLWMFEAANALLTLLRRKKIQPQQGIRARGALSRLHPLIDDDGPRLALHRIWELADEYSLSIYDAVYLELAQRKGLPLASRDKELRGAAVKCGIQVLL
ncbi:MAG: type II toxin-antitoxin system VapC family toxin [Bryobacteraceae bacterium]